MDLAVTNPPSGWITSDGSFYVTSGVGLSPVDPTAAFSGSNFVTANRLAPNPDDSFPNAAQRMSIYQSVDVSAFAPAIDGGDQFVDLSFAYNSADAADDGVVTMSFLDGASTPLGGDVSFRSALALTEPGNWERATLLGSVPAGTRTVRISLAAESVGGGTARNVSFDGLSAQLLSEPVVPARDVVNGNLIQVTGNGAWSWFQDERAIVDQQTGNLIVGALANRGGVGGNAVDGHVKTTFFNLNTGRRTEHVLNDLESYGGGDDHNLPGLLRKADGDVLAFYAAHNNLNGVEDDRSYYRTFDSTTASWGVESEYHWWEVIPNNAPGSGGTTYSNVFQLEAEDEDGDGHGRIYNIARTQQSPHVMYSDDNGATWQYGGQLTKQPSNPPADSYVNGYYKYSSNGVDRIDIVATEFHPRDYNTSIYHAYIQAGKLYDSLGKEIDADIFDSAESFDSTTVPSTDDFSRVFQAGAQANSRAWMSDVQRYEDGTLAVLFKARKGGFGSHTSGANDHRVWYARFDGDLGQWHSHEIAKAGGQLFSGQETDYTGLGALHPNDPDTIYISTEVSPVSGLPLAHHEIFKGVTGDDGATWEWTAITENSSYDNLRPIVPSWDAESTAVLWWRGTMSSSQYYDAAVVGVIEREREVSAAITYHDASPSNTTLSDGSPVTLTGPGSTAGAADGHWHLSNDLGNGGDVITADGAGPENAPTLRTSIDSVAAGTYDIYVLFWCDVNQDWQIEAGLSADELTLYRALGAQQAVPEQFKAVPLLNQGSRSLYRAYVGRVALADGESIELFVSDSNGDGAASTWYDGIGLSEVASAVTLPGDFNGDGVVDAADYTVWRDQHALGVHGSLPTNETVTPGEVTIEDYEVWRSHFGGRLDGQRNSLRGEPAPEPTALLLLQLGAAISQLLSWPPRLA